MQEMDLAKCIGVMVVGIKVIGKMEYKMDKDKFIYLVKWLKRVYFKIMY